MGKLTDKQEMFCLEYLKDLNATQAAIRAGYSKKTAKDTGCENLAKPNVAERVAELKAMRSEVVKMDAQDVLRRLKEIDELDVLDIIKDDLSGFKKLSEWPKAWRTSVSGIDMKRMVQMDGDTPIDTIIEKIKWPDKVKNLEMIGRHVEVRAWDKDHDNVDDQPIGKIEIEVVGANTKD